MAIIVRCATTHDAPAVRLLLELGRDELKHSLDIQKAPEKAEQALAFFASSPAHFFYVLEEDGDIVGAFVGMLAPIWWAHDDIVSDLFFYVSPRYRGHGYKLIKRFVAWARGFDSVRRIIVSNSTQNERASHLYKRLGFIQDGSMFVMEV